ncbi:MAG TPA: hypothetical protein VFA26_21965 [Gemmataceae bacterium]|nr:hypothetical protein [Gemmataceae bacterium]
MAAEEEFEAAPRKKPPAHQPPPPAEDDFDEEEIDVRRRDDGVASTLIPYKNGAALAAYYCGIFALIPALGCILSPLGIILGVIGLIVALKHPQSKGMGHAIAGIVLGLIVAPAVWVGVYFLVGLLAGPGKQF